VLCGCPLHGAQDNAAGFTFSSLVLNPQKKNIKANKKILKNKNFFFIVFLFDLVLFVSFFCFLYLYCTGCLKIREFRIQSVLGKDSEEFEKYLEKKIALPEEEISTLILFNT
jgi:hypothetical protein